MPVKLGLAGGPLIVAILFGRFGFKLKLVAYTTNSASLMIRDIGLVLFLASVGLKAGGTFVETVMNGGLLYVLYGFIITFVPCLIIGLVARWLFHLSYFSIVGMIAGGMTDAPTMAYAYGVCDNNQVPVAYSTVYPLTMFLRVIVAQIMVLVSL